MKKHLAALAATAALLFMSAVATADTANLSSAEQIRLFTDHIMTEVANNDLGAAFDQIKKHSVVEPEVVTAMSAKAIEQRNKLAERIGAPIGFEWLSAKTVGDSLQRLQYLEKTPKHALLWTFYFYKTTDGWLLSTWGRDEQYEQLFMLN